MPIHFTIEKRTVWCPKGSYPTLTEDRRVDDHYVERPVAVCTACKRYGSSTDEKYVEHDSLCTYLLLSPEARVGRLRGGAEHTTEVLRALFARAGTLLGQSPDEAKRALAKLMEWSPERWPDGFRAKANGAEKGDEKQPFFSEAYLYPLFGKDDARTILALLHAVQRALGEG